MSRQSKILVLLMLVAVLAVMAMGCGSAVKVEEFTIGGDYQTDYFIGDDLNITGMELNIRKSNDTEETVLVQDVMQDVKFLNFNTDVANEAMEVTLRYKNKNVTFIVAVRSQDYSSTLCTVKFETSGGSTLDSIKVPLYSTIPLPQEPTKAGYGFGSWYEDEFLSNEWNFQLDKVEGDMTLYAEWLYQYKITFYAQPKESATNYVSTHRYVNDGGTLTSIPKVPTVEGSTGSWDRNAYSNIKADISVYPVYVVDTYTITFYDNGSGESKQRLQFQNVEYGTDLLDVNGDYYKQIDALQNSLESTPSKLHHHFVGWISDGATVDLTKVQGNINAYTDYEIDKFDITYMWNTTSGDLSVFTQVSDIAFGSLLVAPTAPTREGYVFKGWFTNADTTNSWDFSADKLSGDQKLYASWIKAHTVVFYQVDGDYHNNANVQYKEYQTNTVSDGDALAKPPVPSIEGYDGDWDIVSLENITDDLTVYPEYTIKEFTVKFVAKGTEIKQEQVPYTSSATAPAIADLPEFDGLVFANWNVQFDYITADTTVDAVYVAKDVTITYDYNTDSLENTEEIGQYGQKISFIAQPTRAGYDFDGWYFEEGALTQCTADYVLAGDVTLYAKWTMLFTITAEYFASESDYEANVLSTITFTVRNSETINEADMPITYPAYGKEFRWLNKADDNNFDLSTKITMPYTIYPHYEDAVYNVVFIYNDDGTPDYTIKIGHGSAVSKPEKEASLEGSTFLGWYKEGESVATDFNSAVIVLEDTKFYARYESNEYTVQFIIKANEEMDIAEEYVLSEQKVLHGQSASQPQATATQIHSGYKFAGWKLADGSNASLTTITEDMECYASYAINTYVIKFVSDDGLKIYYTTLPAKMVEYLGSPKVFVGETPTKTGYTFIGWDYTGDRVVTLEDDIPQVTADLTVRAVFAVNKYEVQFDVTGSGAIVNAQSIDYNKTATKPVDPQWTNNEKSFLGWYSDAGLTQKFTFSTPIKEAITLYSKWAVKVDASGASYDFDKNKEETELFVSDIFNITSTEITIPNYVSVRLSDGTYETLPVVGIGASAIANKTNLEIIYLPSTLKFIGVSAFSGCTSVTKVCEYGREYMPDGLIEVGENAFSNCVSLQSMSFDAVLSELVTIGNGAFSTAKSLVSFTLPTSYDITIGDSAFFGCTSLLSFDFGANVTSIGNNAFKNNTALRYVEFSRTRAPELSGNAFSGVSNAFRIYVIDGDNYASSDLNAEGWTTYASRVIDMANISDDGSWSYTINATGITLVQYLISESEVVVPSHITIDGQSKLVTAIGANSFDKSITSIIFSTGNVSLSKDTLAVASGLRAITIQGTDQYNNNLMIYIKEVFNIAENLTTLKYVISNNATLSELFVGDVPSGLTTIEILEGSSLPNNMFKNSKFITTVILPAIDGYQIGEYAFYGCDNLETVMFSNGTSSLDTQIGASAFENALSLTTYASGKGLQILDANIVKIGANALKNTKVLQELELSADTAENKGFVIIDNILYSYNSSATYASDVVTIPTNVIAINDYAFQDDTGIRAIIADIANTSLIKIGTHAFAGCYNLETIMLPASLTDIGEQAFAGCTKLAKVIALGETAPQFTSDIFDDAISNIELYVFDTYKESYESLAQATNKSALAFTEFDYSNDKQFVTGQSADSGKMAIYYIGNSSIVTVDNTYDSIANYAFSRFSDIGAESQYITDIVIENSGVAISQNTFIFLKEVERLALGETAVITEANATYIYKFIERNSKLATIIFDGANTLANIVNGNSLPSYVENVDLSGATQFVDDMLLNQSGIKNIVLPTTIDVTNIGINIFNGTGWVANQTTASEFITIDITGGKQSIVYYAGDESVVTLPTDTNITAISKGVFQDNKFVEMVIMDQNINYIADKAFENATQLVKVVVLAYGSNINVAPDAFVGTADGIETIKFASAITTVVGDAIESALYNDGDVYYTYNDSGATIQFMNNQTDIVVPQTVSHEGADVAVVAVGNNAFTNRASSILITTAIDWADNAIENLKNIETLTLSLGNATNSETPITVADSYKQMLSSFANNNPLLNHIKYDGGIALKEAFNGNAPTTVKTVSVTEGAENLVNDLLSGFINVATINIPETIKTLGYRMFEQTAWYNAQNYTNYIIMSNGWLYKYTGGDESPIIPASVKVINTYAFADYDDKDGGGWIGNTSMISLRFEANSLLTTIMGNAFYGCHALKNINLPLTATTFAEDAFNSCGIVANGDMLYIESIQNDSYTLIKYIGNDAVVTIPDKVKVIADNAFANNTNLTELVFGADSSLAVIGAYAFSGCTNLATMALPNTVKEIGAYALNDTVWYTNAEEVVIINNRLVLYTGNNSAFTYDYSNVTSIAKNAFNSSDVSEITVVNYHSDLAIDEDTEIAMGTLDKIYVNSSDVASLKEAWATCADKIEARVV